MNTYGKCEKVEIYKESSLIDELNKMLDSKDFINDCGKEETIFTITGTFSDGFEADIKVCNGDPPFVDPVLFNPEGIEVCVLDCEDMVDGRYEFKYNNKTYIIHIHKDNHSVSRDWLGKTVDDYI